MSEPDLEMADYMNSKFGPFTLHEKVTLTSRKYKKLKPSGRPTFDKVDQIPCDLCGSQENLQRKQINRGR